MSAGTPQRADLRARRQRPADAPVVRSGQKDFVDRALGHADRELAETEAKAVSAALLTATGAAARGIVTVGELLAKYERAVLPKRKTEAGRQEARRRINLWQAFLGATRDVQTIEESDIDRSVANRGAGRIALEDHELAQAPGPRAIGADLEFLRAVFNWGRRPERCRRQAWSSTTRSSGTRSRARRRRGDRWRSYDRFLALRAQCDAVDPQQLFGAFMDLVEALGWRESAICQLWASDYDRRRVPKISPFGRIRKRWETDKEGVEMWVPISKSARAALELMLQRRPVVGDVPFFPAQRATGKPWNRWHARQLLERAKAKATTQARGGRLPPVPAEVGDRAEAPGENGRRGRRRVED